MKNSTLKLESPFGLTILYILPVLIAMLGIVEALSRIRILHDYLPTPNIGSSHYELNTKLDRLEAFAEEGNIDCFIIGSSLPSVAFDPDTLSQAFEEQAGHPLRCFNMGLSSFTVSESAFITDVLIEEYHPDLIIYGITLRDFQPDDDPLRTGVLTTPWAQQYLDQKTITGWLTNHSTMYRYYLAFALESSKSINRAKFQSYYQSVRPNGWRPRDPTSSTPDELVPEDRLDYLTAFFDHYDFEKAGEDRRSLDHLMEAHRAETDLILVEMPVSEVYWDFFPEGYAAYADRFVSPLADITREAGITFIQTNPEHPFTLDNYYDYHHLNREGAVRFSRLIGEQIGQMAINGELPALDISQD